jgi:hypothetical protein
MNAELDIKIKYRPDGSIDTSYYMEIGRQKRSEQAHELTGKVSRRLSPKRFQISGKHLRSTLLASRQKLQGA